MEPSEIKVIVHGARNLVVRKSRKGKCKASVVFGIGDQRYQTSEIKDCNPDWNEESVFRITKPNQPLVLSVKDKYDVIGTIHVCLEDIGDASKKRRLSLGPHKKQPSLGGELIFDCWVTEYSKPVPSIVLDSSTVEANSADKSQSSSRKLDSFLKRMSPKISRHQYGHENNNGSFSLRRCNSTPFKIDQVGKEEKVEFGNNLRVQNNKAANSTVEEEKLNKSKIHIKLRKTFDHSKLAHSWEKRRSGIREPKISDIFPWTAHAEGGTKVTISGDNFGWKKSDITSLKFCDVECKESIVFISTRKLECRPPPSSPKEGHLEIETIYGTKGQSATLCQYADLNNPFDEVHTNPFETIEEQRIEPEGTEKNSPNKIIGMISKKLSKPEKEDEDRVGPLLIKLNEKDKKIGELQTRVGSLEQHIQILSKEKEGLQRYIDGLVAKVIEVCPEALESCEIYH